MKKIMIGLMAAVLLFGLLPGYKGLAYTGGLLHGKAPDTYTSLYGGNGNITNGSLSNYTEFSAWGAFAKYSLTETKTINRYYIKSNQATTLELYNTENSIIQSVPIPANSSGGFVNLTSPVPDVKYVRLIKNHATSTFVYEFDVFEGSKLPFEGLLDGKEFVPKVGTTSNIKYITDNNETTEGRVNYIGTVTAVISYTFDKPVYLKSFYINSYNAGALVRFFSPSETYTDYSVGGGAGPSVLPLPDLEVSRIEISNPSSNYLMIREFDVQGAEKPIVHDEQNSLTSSVLVDSVELNWNPPLENPDFLYSKIYRNGELIKTTTRNENNFKDTALGVGTYNYKITAIYSDKYETTGTSTTATIKPPPKIYAAVKDLTAEPNEREVSISWTNPTEPGIKETEIYLNGTLKKTVSSGEKSANISGLTPDTDYKVSVVTVYEDGGIATTEDTFKTLVEIIKKVLEAKAKVDYDRVDLSWTLPKQYGFHHVNIYRKEITEEPGFFESLFMGVIVSAAEEPEKIFETDGTYFKDFTVTPETSYEYTLTTETTEGKVSDPVIVEATTLEEPAPTIEGEKFVIDEKGDYVFSWDKPTEGTVKIIVGGAEYTTTEATAGSYTIPKSDMKYTAFGDPDVKLTPISKYGTIGESKKISEKSSSLKIPFTAHDFVLSGFELFAYVGSFLLLSMAFLLFPKLRKVIVNSFRGSPKGEKENIDNTSLRRFRDIQNEARERHEGKEHLSKTEREIKERQDKERIERERQEREKRERAAEPKVISPKPYKERARSRQRAEKQPRAARAARQPRERTRAARQPREARGKRRA